MFDRSLSPPQKRCSRTLLPYVLPQVRGRSRERNRVAKLEAELDGQLNAARASAADEGVADADVASGGDREVVRSPGCRGPSHFAAFNDLIARYERIRDVGRQERVTEVGVIEKVEEIGAELHVESFRNRRGFIKGKVPFLKGRTMQRVAAFVAVMAGSRNAVCGTAARRG